MVEQITVNDKVRGPTPRRGANPRYYNVGSVVVAPFGWRSQGLCI